MIVLYILLGLVGLIVLALFVNVNLILTLSSEPKFKVRILFFTFDMKRLADRFSKDGESEAENGEIQENAPKKRSKLTFERIKKLIERFVELVKAVTHEFCRYVRVKICYVWIKIATDDAADTARAYAKVSAVVWTLLEFLSCNMKVKRCDKKVAVFPDFLSNESQMDIKLVLRIKPIHMISAAMHLLPIFMKRKVRNK